MAEEERNLAKADLVKQEEELATAQRDRDSIRNKLVMLERKIIVGGENLLEKAEEQVILFKPDLGVMILRHSTIE